MTVTVRFLGTGDATCAGGRGHACIHVSAPGTSLLLDCGSSALPAIKRAIDPDEIDAVAVTHLHGDHFVGIPGLLMEQHLAGRARPFVVAGSAGLAERIQRVCVAIDPEFFPLRFEVRYRTLGPEPLELAGALVSARPVRHSARAESHGLRVRVDGKVVAYSGDATWSDEIVALARGADLFICESTYFESADPGHMTYRVLESRRGELDCKRIVLTHLGAEALAHAGEIAIECARDDMTVEL